MNKPKYTVTNRAMQLKGQIIKRAKNAALYVHATQQMYHDARIRNAYSTIAMKNNKLTQEQVSDIIDDKYVDLTAKEILEVKNAYAAYSLLYHRNFESINPFSITEMLSSHHAFMAGLSKEAGRFRTEPSAKNIPRHMEDLMEWAKTYDEHLFIKSCVVHYDIILMKPFADGNEFIARKWQILLLLQRNDVSLRIPLLNVVYERRQKYYDILAIANKAEGCTKFIEFMLQAMSDALAEYEKDPLG